jgi:hypothetical protein
LNKLRNTMSDRKFEFKDDPTAEEAAAVISAIERFLADTTSPPAEAHEMVSGWLRAALEEGVGSSDNSSLW